MSDDILTMDYASLMSESGEIKRWASKFETDMQDTATRIGNMTWEGGSGGTFKTQFTEANKEIDVVRQQIHNIGLLLARCADGINDADKRLAQQLMDAF